MGILSQEIQLKKMKSLTFFILILIALQVQGIPRRKRPEPEWRYPDYGYVCGLLEHNKGFENSVGCEEFCGSDAKYKITSEELRNHCCDSNGRSTGESACLKN